MLITALALCRYYEAAVGDDNTYAEVAEPGQVGYLDITATKGQAF